jgi:hypothetical protein
MKCECRKLYEQMRNKRYGLYYYISFLNGCPEEQAFNDATSLPP